MDDSPGELYVNEVPGELYINDVKVGNVTSSDIMIGQQPQAKVEIVIGSGKIAKGKKVRLNGVEVPNVRSVSVEYEHDEPRVVVIEVIATDVIEVPE